MLNILVCSCCANTKESIYSPAISRMEREWLHKEFPQENDDKRISRLEEIVFGTIHDIDLNTRYIQLKKAFDTKKNLQVKHSPNFLYGTPTSIPMNVDQLLEY